MNRMRITANGKAREIAPGTSVAGFIRCRGLAPESCIAELNGEPVERPAFETTILNEGDHLEVVRAVAGGAAARRELLERLENARLYFICGARPATGTLDELLGAAARGGADLIQLRDHEASDRELLGAAAVFRAVADRTGALFIVNDRPDIAVLAGADGVHVGQDDLPPADVRRLAGPELIIGLSTHSQEEIEAARGEPVDYTAVGPVHETPTKKGRGGTGLNLIAYAVARCNRPFFAIGGIDVSNASEIIAAGAERIAVVRAIAEAGEPEAAARQLADLLGPEPAVPK